MKDTLVCWFLSAWSHIDHLIQSHEYQSKREKINNEYDMQSNELSQDFSIFISSLFLI